MPNTDSTTFDVAVRRAVYEHTMRVGQPPSSAETAHALQSNPTEVLAAFGRLAKAHVLVLQPEGEILMANPFSAVPTPFMVAAGGQTYYGNCIWDALGIPAMLGAAAQIRTACPCCGAALEIAVQDNAAMAPSSVAHFAVPAAQWWDDIVYA